MKRALILALVCTSSIATAAFAQTYQWKDSTGKTIISDSPPPASSKASRTINTPPPAREGNESKSYAERDMEFKKRQLENKEKAEKEAKEASANAERKENCERARRQLAVLQSGQRMSTVDANGERKFIEDAERQQEIARTQRFVSESCK